MEVQLINNELLEGLHEKAAQNERRRMNFDLRTTAEDGSQRMLNVLEPGTHIPIHRHLNTSESVICLEGCLDWVFYEELPNMDAGGRCMTAILVQGAWLTVHGLRKLPGSECVLVKVFSAFRFR